MKVQEMNEQCKCLDRKHFILASNGAQGLLMTAKGLHVLARIETE